MSKELLPCPFCGGEATLQPVIGAIVCSGCHVEVYAPRPLPRTEAWNKRVNSPDVSGIKKLLEEHGCSCECSHHEDAAEEWEDHEDCNPCLACLISEALHHSERR